MGFCPTCGSPSPERHPAMQFEGEVQPCGDPYHLTVTPSNTPERVAAAQALVPDPPVVFTATTFEVEIVQSADSQEEADAMPSPEADDIERILDLELAHLGIHRVTATRQ